MGGKQGGPHLIREKRRGWREGLWEGATERGSEQDLKKEPWPCFLAQLLRKKVFVPASKGPFVLGYIQFSPSF